MIQTFPYADLEDTIYFRPIIEDSPYIKQRPDVELYRRFPWLQFRKSNHKKKYVYLGRDTEQTRPFFIRFNLSEESQESAPDLSLKVSEMLRLLVDGVLSPEKFKNDINLEKNVRSLFELSMDQTLFPSSRFCVHHGYLLTGIAKPSTTANEAFDTLFPSPQMAKKKGVREDESSLSSFDCKMNGFLEFPNAMKMEWQYKYHSYQYFHFMSRAYMIISEKLRSQNLPQDEVEENTCKELFNFSKARISKFLNSQQLEKVMLEKQYYTFFSDLFRKYHRTIIEQIEQKTQQKEKIILIFDGHEHELLKFDFKTYFKRQFMEMQLSEQSLMKMVNKNRQRHTDIINNFPFKTRRERIALLQRLQNTDRGTYNRIELLPMIDLEQQRNPAEEDHNFLILFKRDEELTLATPISMRQFIDSHISKGQIDQNEELRLYKQKIFYDIYRQQTKGTHFPLMTYFSCDPECLLLEENLIMFDFQHALSKFLQFDKLPLTLEQELMLCTPRSEINIYQQLEAFGKEYQSVKKQHLKQLCQCLSDQQGIRFQVCDDLQEDDESQQQEEEEQENEMNQSEQQKEKTSVVQLQLKIELLQLSMIDYEMKEGRCCLVDEDKHAPYDAFTPNHYKKLKQQLAILLLKTRIIKGFKPIGIQKSRDFEQLNKVKAIYKENYKKYRKNIQETSIRKYYRQADQTAFRQAIKSLYEDFEIALNSSNHRITRDTLKIVKEPLKIAFKAHIVIEFLQARINMQQRIKQGNIVSHQELLQMEKEYIQSLKPFQDSIEALTRQEKQQNRQELFDRWKNQYPRYHKDLKESVEYIRNEFNICRDILRSSSQSQKILQSIQQLHSKRSLVIGHILVVFCGIYSNLIKLQDDDIDRIVMLYKILICFCCHLTEFHRNQILQYQINPNLNEEMLKPKIYKFKNVLLTELVKYAMDKYFLAHSKS